METVLLTGATGFIGSHVAKRLLACGSYRVIAIVRKITAYKNVGDLMSKGAVAVEGTFYEKQFIKEVFNNYPVERVIHIAAIRGEGRASEEDYDRVNVSGTRALLDESLKHDVSRFIFCSSVGVLGTIPGALPGRVDSPLNGDTLYHRSKIMAEKEVFDYIKKGLDACIIRPAITYGEGDDGFPSKVVRMTRRGVPLFILRDNLIHLLDVGKLSEMFEKTLGARALERRVLIAADSVPVRSRDLARLIRSRYGKRDFRYIMEAPDFMRRAILSLVKLFAGRKRWVQAQLIMNDWYYDLSEPTLPAGLSMGDTRTQFLKYLD